MSEKFKLRYEVVAILKANIIKGMESFGLPITETPGDNGWVVMESDQPSLRNADNAVLFNLEHVDRIGWQGEHRLFNEETGKFDVIDCFIEQQIWKIRVLCKRTTKPISDDDIPVVASDVTGMLIAWFNRLGCIEFRKHNMANLFVQMKDVRTYKDKSDVNQWTTEFPLKLQVVKQFETEIDTATPVYGGSIPMEGMAARKVVVSTEEGFMADGRRSDNRPDGFFKRIFRRLGFLPNGISQENPTRASAPQEGMKKTTGEQNGNQ